MSTFETLAKASSMGHWSLNGRQQLVKVVSASGRDYLMNKSEAERFGGGYITEKRYLWGLNNRQMEQVLGLRPHELKHVAFVFGLSRLPTSDEVDFRLTADFPDGKSPFETGGTISRDYTNAKTKAEAEFATGKGSTDRSYWPVVDFYPMGSGMVPQWQVRANAKIPVSGLLATVTQDRPFPRENGSVKPYTPHNKGPIRV
ncbi:hypothetical protein AB9F29_12225 [Falsihalocynthiibacter sp. S25ZX9]|uniref:hypothetical protein n=1 Tax=Falsihalocynthiibacter sp. S25ZX9 TaxID=3240870 RepID=UPI00350FBFA1